jgi:NADH:ubiquinone oxidoreductase subunit F (NADH-binding)/(2Fe-2S) ferredoxin
MKIATVRELNKLKAAGEKLLICGGIRIQVGASRCGVARGAQEVIAACEKELKAQGLKGSVIKVGCIGMCYAEPLVEVLMPGMPKLTYGGITADMVPSLVKSLAKGKPQKKNLLYRTNEEMLAVNGKAFTYAAKTPAEVKSVPAAQDSAFLKTQLRIAMRNAGVIDPLSIEEYVARGGYAALLKAVTRMKPEEIIETVTKANLRGRGGGGFPTGHKWQACREAHGKQKYVLCNCSEGDPGIGMHKSIIESDPHGIIEGMIIGGYAIGAQEGYIYLHHGNPGAKEKLAHAIDQAYAYGLLGEDILGSGFSFSLTLKEGAGGYVCGESTALMATLEGRAGEPRPKYIHTAEKGLWDGPTNLNNVETWCNIPPIIMRGARWYASIGTAKSTGTKVISISGNVNTPCLVEVPMGTPIKEIINKLGGGLPAGSSLKAFQLGGPPAGIVPAEQAGIALGFDELAAAGSLLGSGGLIVMDQKTCMVDMAKYFLCFLERESCGRCVPCREGVKRMREVVEGISIATGKEEDIALLNELAQCLAAASLCDLGKSAPQVVVSTLRYFRDEYQAHIVQEVCPAKRCSM